MKVKLTKEEFIKRSMNGEVFELYDCKYFYDEKEINPFRIQEAGITESWGDFDGVNEFKVIEPKPKTKIVKEWMYKNMDDDTRWAINSTLRPDKEALEAFKSNYIYQPTGREFEVPDE